MLMGMGLIGWLASLVGGFVVGGVFFLSIKAQVNYVLRRRGPVWLAPALMYARMVFMGLILTTVALSAAAEKVPAILLAAVVGSFVARCLVSRMVKRGNDA